MMTKAVLITGVNGGIGSALAACFREAGFRVIGTDRDPRPTESAADVYVQADLQALVHDASLLEVFRDDVRLAAGSAQICILVNNAACQHVAPTAALSPHSWFQTLDVNLSAPFFLTQALLPALSAARGVILNIGSVHASATKPGFAAYATSKAALHGLTRALAVDLGPQVRVVGLAPAAVATPMLVAGFDGNEAALQELESVHPAGKIAEPLDVARAALYLTSEDASFVTGTTFFFDGGILSRLHDPV